MLPSADQIYGNAAFIFKQDLATGLRTTALFKIFMNLTSFRMTPTLRSAHVSMQH